MLKDIMPKDIKIYGIAILALLATGFLIGWFAHKPRITPVEIEVSDEPIRHVDTLKTTDTLWRDGKIVYIVDTMRVKDLPWIPYDSRDSIVIKSADKRYPIEFQLRRWIKGLDGGYEIFPLARTFTIDVPQDRHFPLYFGLSTALLVNTQKSAFFETETFTRWKCLQAGVGLATDRGLYGKLQATATW